MIADDLWRGYQQVSENLAEDEREFMENHWANDVIHMPYVLILAIETKIAEAELAERRRIIELLISEEVIDPDDECGQNILELINEGII